MFAHGSRDDRWRQPVEAVAALVSQLDAQVAVRCAYLELATPDLAGAVADLVDRGVRSVELLPLFLGVGKHLREDLPRLVDELRNVHPGTEIRLRPAIGETQELIEVIARIALRGPSESTADSTDS
nr:CbiX/SirB N-terminal domain-containing protein [Variovorax dokdonensis]